MTVPSPTPPPSLTRSIARRTVGTLLVLLVVSGWLFTACGEDWKKSVYTFDSAENGRYRVRITGGTFGDECVKLERYSPHSRFTNWRERGRDCAWPRVAGGDGWLAGGKAEPVSGPDWLFYGIVPAAATEVVITLADGVPHPVATREAGDGANRIYVHHQAGVGAEAEVVGLRLHDARGGELRVF